MSRINRPLLLAALVLTLGLSGITGVQAQPAPGLVGPVIGFCNIHAYGYGSTAAEAQANALAELKSKYFVFSYSVVSSRCLDSEIPDPTPLDPFHTQTITICEVELKACGIRKAVLVVP
jgi:hypothetical protein